MKHEFFIKELDRLRHGFSLELTNEKVKAFWDELSWVYELDWERAVTRLLTFRVFPASVEIMKTVIDEVREIRRKEEKERERRQVEQTLRFRADGNEEEHGKKDKSQINQDADREKDFGIFRFHVIMSLQGVLHPQFCEAMAETLEGFVLLEESQLWASRTWIKEPCHVYCSKYKMSHTVLDCLLNEITFWKTCGERNHLGTRRRYVPVQNNQERTRKPLREREDGKESNHGAA